MEISDDIEFTKKCFKPKQHIISALNIVYSESNTMFLFWNKYQIFVYEDLNFECAARVFVPEFQVQQIIASNNYLVCLDYDGNAHVTSLKFKNSAQKRFKSSFQHRDQGILTTKQNSHDTALTLKCESGTYFLNSHKINADFQLEQKSLLTFDKELPVMSNESKYSIYSHAIGKEIFDDMKELFNTQETLKEHSVVLVSFNEVVYGCMYSQKTNHEAIQLKKLYSSPVEICDIHIVGTDDLSIVIGLTTGTVIRCTLNTERTEIAHLNTAFSKFVAMKSNNAVMYTDGVSMWRTEKPFIKHETEFKQFFVKHVKDFVKFGDQIICSTFSNLIYLVSIEDESAYFKTNLSEYCLADKVFDNSESFQSVTRKLLHNGQLIRKINEEGVYLTALSLSNRQDIMDKIINNNVIVYENYEDVIRDHTDISVTEDLQEYFKADSFFFLITLTMIMIQHTFSTVLTMLLGNVRLHITLSSEKQLLKATSVMLSEPLKKLQVLIPLDSKQMKNTTQINVNIKLVTKVPGWFDKGKDIWTVLYTKNVVLKSEHFIKTNMVPNNYICLRQSEETNEDLILKTACIQHGDLFTFTDTSKFKIDANEWSFYVKLPTNYKEILDSHIYFKPHFDSAKAYFLQQNLTAEEFLKSNSNLCFEIGDEKVKLEITNDFTTPLLRVICKNLKIAFDIRNFFSSIIYDDFVECNSMKEFVNFALYTAVENLQKAVKKSITDGAREEFLHLGEQFQKNIIGAIPF